jgi:hypothetical protein
MADKKRNPLAGLGRSEPPPRYTETIGAGRKRRKDATGRKKDYHRGTQTFSVRLPDEVARRLRARLRAERLSANAWLAQVIAAALEE